MDFTIVLQKEEIDYDLNMITHVIANRELAAGVSVETVSNFSNTDDQSGEVHLVDRFIEGASADLEAALARYLPKEADESDNNLSRAKITTFVFLFAVPDNFNTAFINPLRSAMHGYIVNKTLYDWFFESKPDEAIKYREKYEQLLEAATSCLHKRKGMLKTKPYPRI